MISVILFLLFFYGSAVQLPLPMRDIPNSVSLSPGGRSSVHGWLWLPTDNLDKPNPSVLRGFWSHHTPEFWTTSPHDFQLLLFAELYLDSPQPELPFAQTNSLVGNEYTFTPPDNFSLNDLIDSRSLTLEGNFFNGSFDTTFERIKLTTAQLQPFPTISLVHYLNQTSTDLIPQLPYLSYPRVESPPCTSCKELNQFDVYLAHLIHTNPDYDQIVHGYIDLTNCLDPSAAQLQLAQSIGATWIVDSRLNTLSSRLQAGDSLLVTLISTLPEDSMQCPLKVLEEIHCVVGPAFADRCDSVQ
jgi:hypothetical protein